MPTGIESANQPFYRRLKPKQEMKIYLFSATFLLLLFALSCDISIIFLAATQNAPINEPDLDNSIRGAQEAQLIQQQQQQVTTVTQADVASNDQNNLAAPQIPNAWIPVTPNHSGEEVWQLDRRLKILEQELRKLFSNQAERQSLLEEQMKPRWTQTTARLELMEKFITVALKKLYETEARVKQLEKCDCKLSCRWKPNEAITASGASSTSNLENNYQNETKQSETSLIKMDGQVWEHKCDVCSCHRGRVRCKHVTCPQLPCSNPQQVVGKCCPVCYKSCVYRNQTVKHGNKLVINSSQDTCKECMCIDGRFKCQHIELPEQHVRSQGTEMERETRRGSESAEEPVSWSQTSSTSSLGSQDSSNNATVQAVASTRQQRSVPRRDQLKSLAENNENDDDYRFELEEEEEEDLDEDETVDNGNDTNKSYLSYGRENLMKNGRNNRSSLSGQHIERPTRGSRSIVSNTLPLVCPQIDCNREDQIYFQNDCCTYCRNFDFCAHKARHSCHPNAACINTINVTTTSVSGNLNLTSKSSLMLDSESMFSCQCKTGFSGDGRFCRDIDECSQKHLNDCDPKTTNCINLEGSYECRCKRGFKPALNFSLDETIRASEEEATERVSVTTTAPLLLSQNKFKKIKGMKSCVDINECSDGILNKCHPQAKCINTQASYKCRCKYGYLGNGFECHQWFSSDPNVAAYFHRHSPSSSTTKKLATTDQVLGEHLRNDKSMFSKVNTVAEPPPHKINMPLESFPDDPNDDQLDDSWATRAEPEGNDDEDNDYNDNYDDDDDGDEDKKNAMKSNGEKTPKLAEFKWEPLKLVAESLVSPSQLQQTQQNLNTRTMFFQPPPIFPTQQVATTDSYDNILNQTISTKSFIEAHYKRNNGAQVNSSPPSDSSNTNNPIQSLSSSSSSSPQITDQQQQKSTSSSSSLYKLNDSPGYKRGTIITSAITSPTRGYSSKKAHISSSSQHHRALGVTSSASTSSYSRIPRSISPSQYYNNNCFNLIAAKFDFINSHPFWLIYLYLYLLLLGSQPYIPIILLSLIHIYIL